MKKISASLLILIFLILSSFLILLSTSGIETKRFNSFITNKINQMNIKVSLRLEKIKFKIDLKRLNLFLQTNNPIIEYRESVIPVENIKLFIDFKSILSSEPQIEKINLILKQLDIKELKKISTNFKPSNLNSFINNRITEGQLNSEVEIFLKDKNIFDNFIIKGSVKNVKANFINKLSFKKIKFNFFADKTDILIKKIYGENEFINIFDGDLKIILSPNLEFKGNFQSNITYLQNENQRIIFRENFKNLNQFKKFNANLNNNFFVNFDKTYKVKDYEFKNNGKIIEAIFDFDNSFRNFISKDTINQISIFNSNISSKYNLKKKITNLSGNYKLNNSQPATFDLETEIYNEQEKLKLNLEYYKKIDLNLINYYKPRGELANLQVNLNKNKHNIRINEINLKHKENSIILEELKLKKNKFLSLKSISVFTKNDGKINNNFNINYGNEIRINGKQFDATNLQRFFNQTTGPNNFININKNIEIDFQNIIIPLSEKLENFKLLGKIEKGKFSKISSKGSFGGDDYLDITMRKDKKNNKRYLEVYSDLTKPLLTEFTFFKGLTDGKLLFSSEISEKNSISKLKIENFKVINAPGMVKLLSLADLGGLADLAEGDGISFDTLEIRMKKSNQLLEISEILALGPSISVLMEGYQDAAVTSLRGTLVPAKTLNVLISKIPFIGDIIIPKEVGEGLFGVSFKIKGPPGKIKTTIDPIRTITPRFIQKIIDREKNTK